MTAPARRDYGPVQLTDYLRQFYERAFVFRARDLGLLPEPDRRGGRAWSAALAEQIRERWPEIQAAAECIGSAKLRERGWTEAMIRDLLGAPDLTVPNPYYRSSAEMRLWRVQRVEAAEAEPGFAEQRKRGERRSAAAGKAAETRRIWNALGGLR